MKLPLINYDRIVNDYKQLYKEYMEYLKEEISNTNCDEREAIYALEYKMQILTDVYKLNKLMKISNELHGSKPHNKMSHLDEELLPELEQIGLKLKVIQENVYGRRGMVLGPYANQESYEMLLLLHKSREANS